MLYLVPCQQMVNNRDLMCVGLDVDFVRHINMLADLTSCLPNRHVRHTGSPFHHLIPAVKFT